MIQPMPVIQSAKKKLRQDKNRTTVNRIYRNKLRLTLRVAKEKKTKVAVRQAYQAVDRAVKLGIIHRNKAGRLKSRLMKLVKK